MYNTFTVAKCLLNCKVCCDETKQHGKGSNFKRRFGNIDHFWKNLVCYSVYGFYCRKLAPTPHMLLNELKWQGSILFCL